MQRYKLLTGLLIAAALVFSTAAVAKVPKIGVIDVNYVVSHSKRGKAASDALQALLKKKKTSLDKEKAKLTAQQADLKGVKNKKTTKFKKELAQFQQSAGAFQQHVKNGQGEIQKRRSELYKPIAEDLRKVIDRYAKSHGYSLILNKTTDAVAYAAQTYNLDSEIVKALDKYEGE
jgi:outer membrane protein